MASDPLIGQHLDEYRLLSILGHGGMARVYLGLDVRLKRYVSIKVIDSPYRSDNSYVVRFQREAQAVAQLEHPHIVRLYRYGEARGLLYMAMQYIEGADLDTVLQSYRRSGEYIPAHDAGRAIRELCRALDYAHSRGVIHRDVKPSNLILDRDGHAYLTDFGLALFAEYGPRDEAFGTPHFMAPEQVTPSSPVTPSSDLYAVGIILYEMFTGELPFDAPDPMDVAWMQVNQTPRPPRQLRPAISPEVEAVILKAMAKAPGDRFPTGAALADALDRALAATVVLTAPATSPNLSIPARVTVELTRNPPPPLPVVIPAPQAPRTASQGRAGAAVSAASIPPRQAPLPRRSAASAAPRSVSVPAPAPGYRRRPVAVPVRRRKRSAFRSLAGCLGVLLILLALAAGVLWAATEAADLLGPGGRFWLPLVTGEPDANLAPTDPPPVPTDPLPIATDPPPEPTPIPVVEITPTPEPLPTDTPEPPPAGPQFRLILVKFGDESLVLVNRSEQPLPLISLRLGNEQGTIGGTEWGGFLLPQDSCVVAVKAAGRVRLPSVRCEPVGQPLVVQPKRVFWDRPYAVYYRDHQVATCREQRCEVEFLTIP